MAGKFLFEFLLPTILLGWAVWQIVKFIYFRLFPKGIKNYAKIYKTDKEYQTQINQVKKD